MLEAFPSVDYREIDVGESEAMRDDFRPAERATNATRYLSGIRADESGVRAMSIRHLGMDTGKSGRPLAWWTGRDVDAIRNLIHRGILLMRQQLPTTLAVERCEWLRDAEEICKKLER
ncbi:MAG: hypothetical protein K2X38_12930 [Gemmataceae bacterium]|nr:hypothetical protein [Gemmataceae bacterium]